MNEIETNKKVFNKDAKIFSYNRWESDPKYLNKVLNVFSKEITINEIKGKKILDIGCGAGYWSKFFSDLGAEVYGIDIAEEMINESKKNCKKGNFIVANSEDIPFKDNYFDMVISIRSLEYFPDKLKSFKEIKRVLKKDGRLIVITKSTPDVFSVTTKIENVIRNPMLVRKLKDRTYGNNYWMEKISPIKLSKLLWNIGFYDLNHYPISYTTNDTNKNEGLRKLFAKIFKYHYFAESYFLSGRKT